MNERVKVHWPQRCHAEYLNQTGTVVGKTRDGNVRVQLDAPKTERIEVDIFNPDELMRVGFVHTGAE